MIGKSICVLSQRYLLVSLLEWERCFAPAFCRCSSTDLVCVGYSIPCVSSSWALFGLRSLQYQKEIAVGYDTLIGSEYRLSRLFAILTPRLHDYLQTTLVVRNRTLR